MRFAVAETQRRKRYPTYIRFLNCVPFSLSYAGWVPSVHRGAAAQRQGVLVHVVQSAGGQTQVFQKTRKANVAGRGETVQGRADGECIFPFVNSFCTIRWRWTHRFIPEHGLDMNMKTESEPKSDVFFTLTRSRPYVAYYKFDSEFYLPFNPCRQRNTYSHSSLFWF